jgi:molybdopterin-binding protein
MSVSISGRNKLKGKVLEVQLGDIMALITVQVGENIVDSVITRKSAEDLNLKPGDDVAALIKATEVMIVKEGKSKQTD